MKTFRFKPFSCAALGILCAAMLSASPVGSVSGTVKDSSGAVIPAVRLTLTNSATNSQMTTVSNPQGEFQFLQLAPSTYSLAATSQGFKTTNISSVLVQVDQVTHVDLTMEVGRVTESVLVEAVSPVSRWVLPRHVQFLQLCRFRRRTCEHLRVPQRFHPGLLEALSV